MSSNEPNGSSARHLRLELLHRFDAATAKRGMLGILGELFQDRSGVGIHAMDLVWGFGSLHCLTQQQPV
jgi:agmatine/peptidylarginine deiminase